MTWRQANTLIRGPSGCDWKWVGQMVSLSAAQEPELKMAISADKDAPFGQIIKVMDAAKEAKIKMVSAFTKETAKP
jgi:biopolymer transport protein ExbD